MAIAILKLRNFQLVRGDTWLFEDSAVTFTDGRTLSTGGVVLRSTIKRYETDPDPGLAQVDSVAGGIAITGDNSFRAVYSAEVTDLFPAGSLHYDIVIDFSAGESYTLRRGKIDCVSDVTRSVV